MNKAIFSSIKTPLLFLSASLGLFGCAGSDKSNLSHTDVCKAQFEEAQAEVADHSTSRSIELLNNLLNNCSGTGFMEDAQYLLAGVYFEDEQWIDARAEYSLYTRHFANSPRAPMASYLAAVSAFNTPFKEGRDGSLTDQAIRDFKDFMDSYPESPKVDSAQYYLERLTERKAQRDWNVSYLYLRMGEPLAAAIYLKDFIKDFPNSQYYNEAHIKLVESYRRLDQFDQARFYLNKILHEVPDLKKDYEDLYATIDSEESSYKARIEKEQKDLRLKATKAL